MSDYIKREDVIRDLQDLWDYKTVDGIKSSKVLKQVQEDVKSLPSADVEPVRHGRWKEKNERRKGREMMINLVWFLIGFIVGVTVLVVVACCYVSGETDEDEERRKWEHKLP